MRKVLWFYFKYLLVAFISPRLIYCMPILLLREIKWEIVLQRIFRVLFLAIAEAGGAQRELHTHLQYFCN